MGSFKQEIEAIIKTFLPTDAASNKIDKRIITSPWDFIVGSSAGTAIKKTAIEVWAYLNSLVGAYTKQQYAIPVVLNSQSGTVTLDADYHQDVHITATGNITMDPPVNGAYGKTMFITLYAASALTITWHSVFFKNADVDLPTVFVAGKRIFLNFRYVSGVGWILLGMAQEA